MTVPADPRHITNGFEMPTETYSDQPYIVRTDDGAWLCCITTGAGREGDTGQHMISMRSTDRGRTWSKPVNIEPPDGPEASWGVLLKVPGGRIYCFYIHNSDNLRELKADDPPFPGGVTKRMDSFGYYVFKYTDDHGRTWSAQRHNVPVREMEIDRKNAYGGKIRYFWNVGRPFIHDGAAYLSLHKVGGLGHGFFTSSEGVLLKSANILTEQDPAKITWETLPDGDRGLRTPPGGGPVAEEHSYCVLSDGAFYAVYRTVDGHPVNTYSRDGGHTWTTPQYKRFANGRLMKHPRAANFAWKCDNGKFVYWMHNHGGRFIVNTGNHRIPYEDRNPVWLCGGVEADTPEGKVIRWSQPEIFLYDDDPYIRMSYPDLLEEGGTYYVTETQKDIARVHEIDPALLEGMWHQFTNRNVATAGLALDLQGSPLPKETAMPVIPPFNERDMGRPDYGTKDLRQGFSVDLWVRFDALAAGQVLLDNRTENGSGFCLQTTGRQTVEIVLNDGRTENHWDCDPGMLAAGQWHHVVAIVDGGPKIITFVVDGVLCDGGDFRQFGWGRYNPNLRGVKGTDTLRIGPGLQGQIRSLRIYTRYLRTSEAIGNYRAGAEG